MTGKSYGWMYILGLVIIVFALLAKMPDADAPIEHDFGEYQQEQTEIPADLPASTPIVIQTAEEPGPEPEPEDTLPEPDEEQQIIDALLREGYLREDCPLSYALQDTLHGFCVDYGVPYELALGLIQVESNFREDADNGTCRGLMQLHRKYFPGADTSYENLKQGTKFLGELYQKYGSWDKALTVYTYGHLTSDRKYANAVMSAAREWGWNG